MNKENDKTYREMMRTIWKSLYNYIPIEFRKYPNPQEIIKSNHLLNK